MVGIWFACETWRVNTRGLALALLAVWVSACAPAEPSSSASTPGDTAGSPTTTRVVTTQDGSCFAALSISGDLEAQVGGNVSGLARRIGTADAGVEIGLSFEMPRAGERARFAFNIGDTDGHDGPKPIRASLTELQSIVISGDWQAGRDPGTATLADDGSSASFDMTFVAMTRKRHARIVGSVSCPAP